MCKSQGIDPPAPLVYTETVEMATRTDRCLSISAGNSNVCGEQAQGEKNQRLLIKSECLTSSIHPGVFLWPAAPIQCLIPPSTLVGQYRPREVSSHSSIVENKFI